LKPSSGKNSSKPISRFLTPLNVAKNTNGAALLMSILIVNIVMFLALEVSNQSLGDFFASAGEVKKVRAYYASKSCLQLSLLRIKAYRQATQKVQEFTAGQNIPAEFKQQIAQKASQLEQIWKFPLAWPPPLPEEASSFDKSTFQDALTGSLLEAEFASGITPESGRIDINDLGSPSKALRERTKRQILERLQSRVQNNEDSFAIRYAGFDFLELVNNIADWVDADTVSLNGGSEKALYSDFDNEFYPPNRPFKTLDELHIVSGMTDEIFAFLESEITLFGGKGVNVNQADKDVLDSLFSRFDPSVTEETVRQIMERRQDLDLGGPFADLEDFSNFISGLGIDIKTFNEERIPLFFGPEINFKIQCTGISGKLYKEISAVVYGGSDVGQRLISALKIDREDTGRNLQDECRNEQGEQKYQCLCQDFAAGTEQTRCIAREKQAEKNRAKKPKKPSEVESGPPPIIFYDVT